MKTLTILALTTLATTALTSCKNPEDTARLGAAIRAAQDIFLPVTAAKNPRVGLQP